MEFKLLCGATITHQQWRPRAASISSRLERLTLIELITWCFHLTVLLYVLLILTCVTPLELSTTDPTHPSTAHRFDNGSPCREHHSYCL
jgi:hypothetical protein